MCSKHEANVLTTSTAEFIQFHPAPVYGFFDHPKLEMVCCKGKLREAFVFVCMVPTCREKLNVYTTTKDVGSTSNLQKHIKKCRGAHHLEEAKQVGKVSLVHAALAANIDGSITAAFERSGKGKISYSTRPLSETQTRYVDTHLQSSMSPADVLETVLNAQHGVQKTVVHSALSKTSRFETSC